MMPSLLHSTLPFPFLHTALRSAFNTIVLSKLITKLRILGLNTSLCNWILDFLTGHHQVVRVGSNTSDTLILNTGAPQGCVLSPLLYSLFTHVTVIFHCLFLLLFLSLYLSIVHLIPFLT
jgi:hypothetical protein